MKKIKIIGCLIAAALLLCGCIPSKELNQKLIVQAIGIDLQDNEYMVTLQVYFPQGGGGQSFVDMSKPNNQIVQGRGETISQAVQDAEMSQGKETFFGHNELIIVGKSLAEGGLFPISSFLNSFNELRPNIHMLVAEDTAEEIVRAQIEGSILPAHVLGKAVSSGEDTGFVTQCTLIDVMKSLKGDGSQIYAPIVGIKKDEDDKIQATFEETAVFQEGRFIGGLDQNHTRGLLWINDQIVRANILVEDESYGKLSVQITRGTTRRKTKLEDGQIIMEICVATKGIINERVSGDISPVQNEDIDRIEKQLANTIQQEMEETLEIGLSQYQSDIFNFAADISKYQPQFYITHQENWSETLPEINCRISVDCNINRLEIETK